MLKVWGRRSSANVQKVMWLVGELKLPHEHIPAGGPYGQVNEAKFRAMNPNGLVPTLEEDGFVLWESNSIVRYLAAKYGAGTFEPFMTGGAGFIGIVLAMLARGRPLWVLLGALLFGISLAMTTALQVAGINIPTDVVQMLPFAMVMLVLVIFARHSVLPPALGLPYVRGDR